MRIKDAKFYISQKQFLEKVEEERKKRPGTGDGTRAMRDVEFYICQELDYQQWLLTLEAKCVAHNYLQKKYQEKWDSENNNLPEPLMSKALRKAADESGKSSRESICSVYFNLFDRFMC